jgi:hypothetical protein
MVSVNEILFISVIVALFFILNLLVVIRHKIKSFETITIGVSIIIIVVLATLSTM